MNEMYRRPGFISLLAILNFIGGILVLAIMGIIARQEKFIRVLPSLPECVVLSILMMLCSYGLWNLKNYGRWLQIAFCSLGILAVPFGTVLSLITLTQLDKHGFKLLFSGKNTEELTAEEFQVLASTGQKRYTKMNKGIIALLLAEILVAVIAVPYVIIFFDKQMQKRTMANLQSFAWVLNLYAFNHNGTYPNKNSIEKLMPILIPVESSMDLSAKDA